MNFTTFDCNKNVNISYLYSEPYHWFYTSKCFTIKNKYDPAMITAITIGNKIKAVIIRLIKSNLTNFFPILCEHILHSRFFFESH